MIFVAVFVFRLSRRIVGKIGDRTEFVDFKLSKEFIKNHQSSSEFEHFDPLRYPPFKTSSSYCFLF